jgi:hypothetical protein
LTISPISAASVGEHSCDTWSAACALAPLFLNRFWQSVPRQKLPHPLILHARPAVTKSFNHSQLDRVALPREGVVADSHGLGRDLPVA